MDPKAPLVRHSAMLLMPRTRITLCSPVSAQCLAQSTGNLRGRHARNVRSGSHRWTATQPRTHSRQNPTWQAKDKQLEVRRDPPTLLPRLRPSTRTHPRPSRRWSLARTWPLPRQKGCAWKHTLRPGRGWNTTACWRTPASTRHGPRPPRATQTPIRVPRAEVRSSLRKFCPSPPRHNRPAQMEPPPPCRQPVRPRWLPPGACQGPPRCLLFLK